MAYNRNMKKRGYNRTQNYLDDNQVGDNPGRPPATDGKGSYDDMLSVKALKDLPKSPVTLIANPYTNALPGSMPYPLLNKFNRILGGRYSGELNLDGGNIKQYGNSVTSGFLDIFDTALIKLRLNYRYLPILTSDTERGDLMIDEMRRAIAEATSVLGSTIFVNQNIYNYVIQTDMPMGSAKTKKVKIADTQEEIDVYYEIQDVIYAMGIMYQTHLQSVILAFNQFNAFRTKQGEMIRMSFNRETPGLNAYFGLMNKKAFLNLWDSLAYTIEGEYVDLDFMTQTNMLGLVSSRRSESMNDSLLEVSSYFAYPDTFKMYATAQPAVAATVVASNPVFDLENMVWTNSIGVKTTFYEACRDLCEKMTANDTLLWVRTLANNNVSDNTRYNECKNDLDTITYCMTYFKTTFNDFRTVLDVMSSTGTNQWSKGVKLKVIKDTDSVMSQNLIVDNIYSMILSGDDDVIYDDATKRWSLFTLWNQYYGIPEHDTYAGGVFLTMSTKTIDIQGNSDTNVGYLPLAFSVNTSGAGTLCRIVNRLGTSVPITYRPVVISENYTLSRLVPLISQMGYKIRVPSIVTSPEAINDYSNIDKSFIYKWMLQICGIASIPVSATGSQITYDYGLDSDIFSVYDIQVEDFTNEVITYARTRSIFRANSVDTSNLGFYGLKTGSK